MKSKVYSIGDAHMFVEYGRINSVSTNGKIYRRNEINREDFFEMVEEILKVLRPADLVELISELNDDERSQKIAREAYEYRTSITMEDDDFAYIDAKQYPIDALQKLKSTNPSSLTGITKKFGTNGWNYVKVENGIAVFVACGSSYAGGEYTRTNSNFYSMLRATVHYWAEHSTSLFMEFRDAIKNDEVVYPMVEELREEQLRKFKA